ncbi:hypothetical protein IQ07DRAFT_630993 [Pyrenochaeta sp. DS3sAY3a]|nr:hypothetical protein IQ07DRAFT_630993 [Pyrenochaeta sp. DS3sAY3a]
MSAFDKFLRDKKKAGQPAASRLVTTGLRSVGVSAPPPAPAPGQAVFGRPQPEPKPKVSQNPLPQAPTSFAAIMGEAINGNVGHTKKKAPPAEVKQPVKNQEPAAKNTKVAKDSGVLAIESQSLEQLAAASEKLKKDMETGQRKRPFARQPAPVPERSRESNNSYQVSWCAHEELCIHWHPSDPDNSKGTWRPSMKQYFTGSASVEAHKSCNLPDIQAKVATLASRIIDRFIALENERLTYEDRKNGLQPRTPPVQVKVQREINQVRMFLNTGKSAPRSGPSPPKEAAKLRTLAKRDQEFRAKLAARKEKPKAQGSQGSAKKQAEVTKSKTASQKRKMDDEAVEKLPKAKKARKAPLSSPIVVDDSSDESESKSDSDVEVRPRLTAAQIKQAALKKRQDSLAELKEARRLKAQKLEAKQKEDEKRKEDETSKEGETEQTEEDKAADQGESAVSQSTGAIGQTTDAAIQTTVTKVTKVKKVGAIKYKTITTTKKSVASSSSVPPPAAPSASSSIPLPQATSNKRKAPSPDPVNTNNGSLNVDSDVPAPKKRKTLPSPPTPSNKENQTPGSPSPDRTPTPSRDTAEGPTAPTSQDPATPALAPTPPFIQLSPAGNDAGLWSPRFLASQMDDLAAPSRKRKAVDDDDVSGGGSGDERASRPVRPLKKAKTKETGSEEQLEQNSESVAAEADGDEEENEVGVGEARDEEWNSDDEIDALFLG